jgi:tRNA(Ile)-lysidine synthase
VFEERIRQTIARHGMTRAGENVLLAVSGGVDSVVLLEVLCELAPELGIGLVIAHLDHGLRGETAREDARFVASLGAARGIVVRSERVDVSGMARSSRQNLEAAAREARRSFLLRVACDVGAEKIGLGHTADDRAETVLFNLTRGAGPRGLSSLRPVDAPLIRPLIEVSRQDVLEFAHSRRLAWREDETNADLRLARNRIRHQILPLLRTINPRAVEALARAADLAEEERGALTYLVALLWPSVARAEEEGRVVLDRSALCSLPAEVRAVLTRQGLLAARGNLEGVEREHVQALSSLITSPRAHARLDLPGLLVRIDREEVQLLRSAPPACGPVDLPIDLGRSAVPELGISLDLVLEKDDSPVGGAEPGVERADADRVAFPLRLRTRRRGDRFQPLGMTEEVRLSGFLMAAKVPFHDRDRLPLLCDRERIIWVVGLRLSEAVRQTEGTRRVLVMRSEAAK